MTHTMVGLMAIPAKSSRKLFAITLVVLLLCCPPLPGHAQIDGSDLDPAFGAGGAASVSIP